MPRHATSAAGSTSEHQWFETTHWSVVLSTRENDVPQASAALEKLCSSYWQPLYGYIRRQGSTPEEAEDLTQAFLAKLLEKNFWVRADPQKGRFRSFLLKALRNYLADQRDRARAGKRGGGVPLISLDEGSEEGLGLNAMDMNPSCEQRFDQQWAGVILERARARLREECATAGKLRLHDLACLTDGRSEGSPSHSEIAHELGMTVSAVKSAVSRLRLRYGELVREEVAQTVSSPGEVDGEMRHLLTVIQN